ncbi:hypothetical protein VC83_08398 [Pseudogymnoascus destructans]|uniref:Uncharacterized protein n=1 Tax=Pseudogymnoascus destructans TaxID=655981 RepID=A0A176ZZ12_9PEZI|nr:uncharacterized protein VC83_08398 [Pseudogymnoascus destructans]OAF55156.1 hypothetical protein VC83_08398 [Pseudogymnoascus destructans]
MRWDRCWRSIWYMRPFAWALDQRESEYLFGDRRGPWAGEELSRALASASRVHVGVRLTVSAWRHVAIGIATRYLMQASKTWEKDHEEAEDGEDFAEGDDDEELELDTSRHIMVRLLSNLEISSSNLQVTIHILAYHTNNKSNTTQQLLQPSMIHYTSSLLSYWADITT